MDLHSRAGSFLYHCSGSVGHIWDFHGISRDLMRLWYYCGDFKLTGVEFFML